MALTENGNGLVMPVSPMYGGYGNGGFGNSFGGDGWWILLLLLFANGGYGFGGGFGGGELYPWMNQAEITTGGFQNAATNSAISSLQNSVTTGFGDVQNALCSGFAGVNSNICNGFAQAEIAENSRQLANMQQMFNLSTQFANCCCDQKLGIANLGADIAREACSDRQAVSDGVRDIIANQTAGIQTILTQMCNDKIDAKNEKIADLERQLTMANLAASQTAQTSQIVDSVYARLDTCPVGTTPVFGRTPIFTCNQNSCGCGCA